MSQSPEEKRAYRRAIKLARRIGCAIEIERGCRRNDYSMTYWVWGPNEVYGAGVRVDPREGEHCAGSWSEVLDHLEDYQFDLALNDMGLSSWCYEQIINLGDLLVEQLVDDWMANPKDPCAALVLADRLEELAEQKVLNEKVAEAFRQQVNGKNMEQKHGSES